MGAAEADQWVLFGREEPFGPMRDNIHAALIASTIANVNRSRSSPPIRVADFMLLGESAREQRGRAGMQALASALRMAASNGKRIDSANDKRKVKKRGHK